MRLSTKLTAGLALACAGVLGTHSAIQLEREKSDLQLAAEREMRLAGTAVQVAVANALRHHTDADLPVILDAVDLAQSDVDVYVYDARRRLVASSRGSHVNLALVPRVLEEALAHKRPVVKFHGPGGLSFLLLGLPLSWDGATAPGAVIMIRPFDDVRRDLAATTRSIVVNIALLVLTISCLGYLLGIVYVRQPLTRILRGMQTVRRGDLTARLAHQGIDELDALADTFNSMVEALAQARERIAHETESRQLLEEGLRRLDKLATVGQLSAGLAHEIGSPLQILNGRARALLLRPHAQEQVRRNAEILVAETERITDIVEQLLRVSRRMPVKLCAFHVRDVADAVLRLLELDAQRRGVALVLACQAGLPPLTADPNQIQQVLINLLRNAVKATPRNGKVTLHITASTLSPMVATASVPSVRLCVTDNGSGMSAEVLHRVFEPFFTTAVEDGGTGLGLAVVKGIVTEHGGTVSATSTVGEGSMFVVELPVQGPVWRNVRAA